MSTEEQIQEAHRAAFALITAALNDPAGNLDPLIQSYLAGTPMPGRTLALITHTLVHHAASAVLLAAGRNTELALDLVRTAALAKEDA